eukprot:NODE_19765_length_828_cov_4.915835.p1 GENE.NODE_19765_length_828_cov_4.915835~~NODE_19765_length_828_cov_4.915835.p1  ORF type:complete len:179 (-),score=51.74 NODE_19765_length_828_cov_4.915835:292-756(-)
MMRQVVEAVEQAPMTVLERAVTRFPFGKNRRDQVPLAILANCLAELSRPAGIGPSPQALRRFVAPTGGGGDGCASGAPALDAQALRAATSVSALAAALAAAAPQMRPVTARGAAPPLTSARSPPASTAQAARTNAHVLDLHAVEEYASYADLSM